MKPSDEILVERLKLLAPQVYHLEVYQNARDQNQENYPCCVYRRHDFNPMTELAGESGFRTDGYEVLVIARDSSELRAIADALQDTYKYAYLVALQAVYSQVKDWQIDTDTESVEFAVEQQDKGYKITSVYVHVTIDTLEGDEPCP